MANAVALDAITFSEFAIGTADPVYTYKNLLPGGGALKISFSGEIVEDSANPRSPAFAGSEFYSGPVDMRFSTPVSSVSFDAGSFNNLHSTEIIVYGRNGSVIARTSNAIDNGKYEHFEFDFGENVISRISIVPVSTERGGFALDSVETSILTETEASVLSGKPVVDALVSGTQWNGGTVTFSFISSGSKLPAYGKGPESFPGSKVFANTHKPLDAGQKSVALDAIAQWGGVSLVKLKQTSDTAASGPGTIRLGAADIDEPSQGFGPGITGESGDVWMQPGTSSAFYFLRELGTALGLKHPDDPGASLPAAKDSIEFSVMSNRAFAGAGTAGGIAVADGSLPTTLMMNDIAAIQHLYGANFAYHGGNDTYAFDPADAKVFQTIWDGGGRDRYDCSAYTVGVSLDLRPGAWSVLDPDQLAVLDDDPSSPVLSRGSVFNALLYQGDLRSLIENATGGTGDDRILGNQVRNVLQGLAGNDTLEGGEGDDRLYGGDGSDALDGDAGNDVLFGGTGSDTLSGGAADDTLVGGGGDDELAGGDGQDSLSGGLGNDDLDGGGSSDSLEGGGGNDTLAGGTSDDLLSGGEGDDDLDGGSGDDSLKGDAGTDVLGGGTGDDDLSGGDGTDFLFGGDGNDILSGGGGNDQITGDDGSDEISGGADNDALTGGSGNDTLDGGNGDDALGGGSGNDTMTGGAGNDAFDAGAGDDVLDGGDGDDVLVDGSGNDTMTGGLGNDGLGGGAGDDVADGGDGDDMILGGDGKDTLIGGTGDDSLYGGGGADSLDGGDGTDQLVGNGGADTLGGGDGDDSLFGDQGDDTLDGGDGDDVIQGGGDADILKGGQGADDLFGEAGTDDLDGGEGSDSLDGGDDGDVITGGLGADVLTGGSGSDVFIYQTPDDSTLKVTDIILDFEQGEDRINLSAIDGNQSLPGHQQLTFGGLSAFPGTAEVSYVLSNGNTIVYVNLGDGDDTGRIPEMKIVLSGTVNLTASDFVL